MRLHSLITLLLSRFATTSPVVQSPSVFPSESSLSADDEFKPDWNTIEIDYNAALERFAEGPTLVERLNTEGSSDVAYGLVISAAAQAAYGQIKSLVKWNKARRDFTQLTTQIMLDHNPNSTQAIAAICYNMEYDIKDPDMMYGLTSQKISIWPASTDYDCFYIGKGNTFWSWGDGGTINVSKANII
ncbi:uncharacterized protein LY79DRAFT_570651 [Colletotrichum navitas]|uniref:DUF7888 domain-containing protein n=1 Tax=Colletotrichum navitas TaxID=681940 RepID=A0AAD8PLQ6_9PEZI|nr:uncharacterized protein LY79DRAFT_570651 [Colletotrichum navitas]KAK1570035.1 hypothetical protein LY79DRAFT_570651 [Colletotrichum navitas]